MSLEPLRARIDEIDASLLRLFQERMDVSAQIAAQKRRDGLPVYDAARERAKAKAFHDAARRHMAPTHRSCTHRCARSAAAISAVWPRRCAPGCWAAPSSTAFLL